VRKRVATNGQSSEKGRGDGEQGGKNEARHEKKIAELKKKSLSRRGCNALKSGESVGRDSVEPGRAHRYG